MTQDTLRIYREDGMIKLLFDRNLSKETLSVLIKTAMKSDDLRDLLLTSAANLIAKDKDANMQLETFSRVVREMISENKPDRILT